MYRVDFALNGMGFLRRGEHSLLAAIWLWCAMAGLFLACSPSGGVTVLGTDLRAEAPPQPVAYDHRVHIEAGLQCERCHAGAFEAKRAGLPPLATCISCHRRVVPDHPEVKKLLEAWQTETPILWTKVNVLPKQAMVQFHHGAHARADIGCEQCHGDVAVMAAAEPVLNVADMGWCVSCHRQQGATDDCLACHY